MHRLVWGHRHPGMIWYFIRPQTSLGIWQMQTNTWYTYPHFHETDRSEMTERYARPSSIQTFVPSNKGNNGRWTQSWTHAVDTVARSALDCSRTRCAIPHCFLTTYCSKNRSVSCLYKVVMIWRSANISEFRTGVVLFRFWIKDITIERHFSFPVLQLNSSLPFKMLKISYTNSDLFFTCEPGNEKRRLILGAFIQNLKIKLQSEPLYYSCGN